MVTKDTVCGYKGHGVWLQRTRCVGTKDTVCSYKGHGV